MKKIITLTFDKTITRLAGYPFGKNIYNQQVKDQIDFENGTCIVFPEQIVRIASSFVQGFFEEIVKVVSVSEVGRKIDIKCNGDELRNSIINDLYS